MRLLVAAQSDVGRVREGNEDSYLVDEPLFVVADGMGGHIAGDVASATAIEAVQGELGGEQPRPEDLADALRDANVSIIAKARADPSLAGMGTTCTLLYVEGERAHIAHIGDSRAYRMRDGRFEQLTEDHTLVERMVREGRISRDEAEHHPQRNVITRALGLDESIDVDLIPLELRVGDRLLLCSDGLSSMLDTDDMKAVLEEVQDATAAAEELIARANAAGGEDNITVILVDVVDEGTAGTATPERAGAQRFDAGGPEPTDPNLVAAQGRAEEDESEPSTATAATDASQRRPWRALVLALLIIAALAGVGWAGVRYALTHSWYIGAGQDGFVTVYQGVPGEVAGVSLSQPQKQTSVVVRNLPDFLAGNVRDGIKVGSVAEANRRVDDLRARAREFSRAQRSVNKPPGQNGTQGANRNQTQSNNQKG